ncbi:HAD family hydrolase [Ornithinimicrobium cavernae]|uniref:HAD family hydrolase n=1 Tax=Ornithinimicrobium cavernae TaxID=2666047 RepID=UPI000D685C21|nr:HAD-IA family hydrolase [Ornithinimicrobium cavernae]
MTGSPAEAAVRPSAPGRAAPRHPVVLFDFDGTLADTIPLILASFRHTVSDVLGEDVTEEEARSWIGRTLDDIFSERYPDHADLLTQTYRTWNLANHDELIRPVEGIPELLDTLVAAGSRLGVVSSKGAHVVRRGLAAVGLDHDFEVVAGLEATALHKPHPDPLLYAAGVLSVAPADCAYVGDAVVDVRAALAAGMRPVAVTWGAGTAAELTAAGPSAVASTAGELVGILT